MTDQCLFCRIARGELPVSIVAESSGALAFRDIHPQAPVHVLVIPREHVESLAHSTDPAQLGEVMHLAARVAEQEGLVANGYRVVTNVGKDGGQTVGHLHVHVLGGRPLSWPPG